MRGWLRGEKAIQLVSLKELNFFARIRISRIASTRWTRTLIVDVGFGCRPCENSQNVEKWLAAIELLRVSERAMDEKRRKSPAISRLPPARSSFHTVWVEAV
jgi:hypothetical protein